jgi:hypothetical protein
MGITQRQVKVLARARASPGSQNSQTHFAAAITKTAKTGERISFVCVGIFLFSQPEFFLLPKALWSIDL